MKRRRKPPMRGDDAAREYRRDVFRAVVADMFFMRDEHGRAHKAGAGDTILIIPKEFVSYPIIVEFSDGQAAKVEEPK